MEAFELRWNEPAVWSVVEGSAYSYSVAHMDDHEIQQSIIEDLLELLRMGVGGLAWYHLFRYLRTPVQIDRVLDALIVLIDSRVIGENGGYLHLDHSRESLQFAMDFAGMWLDGFDPPEGVVALRLSDTGREMIERLGADDAAHFLLMDMFCSNGDPPKSIN